MQSNHELPNLNFGMQVKQLQCSVHATIVSNILDHYMRRPQDEETVVGTLLGSVDGQIVDLQTCFSVPTAVVEQEKKKELVIDQDYLQKMLKFHRKVNPKEDMVGFYVSGQEITKDVLTLFTFFQQLSKEKKNKSPLAGSPLLLLIDPTMQNNRLDIKILSILSGLHVPVFSECAFSFQTSQYEKSGLDILFFGQQHYDTMAIMQSRENYSQDKFKELTETQKLLNNKDLMLKNFKEVIDNLQDCEQYIQDVLDGVHPKDSQTGRLLADCMAQFSTDDMALLEASIASNFEDALMIGSLSKLQQHQLHLSEKLNSILAENVFKHQSLAKDNKLN